jgi:hypothetical protein
MKSLSWFVTLPHAYGRSWVWTIFVAFLSLFFFLRWQAWFTAVIYARLVVEVVLCYRDLKVLEWRHRQERRLKSRTNREASQRCRALVC